VFHASRNGKRVRDSVCASLLQWRALEIFTLALLVFVRSFDRHVLVGRGKSSLPDSRKPVGKCLGMFILPFEHALLEDVVTLLLLSPTVTRYLLYFPQPFCRPHWECHRGATRSSPNMTCTTALSDAGTRPWPRLTCFYENMQRTATLLDTFL
jgi:hypothetical protein